MPTASADERYLVDALRGLGHGPEVCREGKPPVGYMGGKRAELDIGESLRDVPAAK